MGPEHDRRLGDRLDAPSCQGDRIALRIGQWAVIHEVIRSLGGNGAPSPERAFDLDRLVGMAGQKLHRVPSVAIGHWPPRDLPALAGIVAGYRYQANPDDGHISVSRS